MPFEFLKNLYFHFRNTLLWLALYFVLQAAIWGGLAWLIWQYPSALFILVVVFLVLFALASLYLGLIVLRYVFKLRSLKAHLEGKISWK